MLGEDISLTVADGGHQAAALLYPVLERLHLRRSECVHGLAGADRVRAGRRGRRHGARNEGEGRARGLGGGVERDDDVEGLEQRQVMSR